MRWEIIYIQHAWKLYTFNYTGYYTWLIMHEIIIYTYQNKPHFAQQRSAEAQVTGRRLLTIKYCFL